ncbi:hypothetical protein PFISCL1PPCAC_17976, partial [Pristionchus fissidentatus]
NLTMCSTDNGNYEVYYNYRARNADEIDVSEGAKVEVLGDCKNGMLLCSVDGKVGKVPKLVTTEKYKYKPIKSNELVFGAPLGSGATENVYESTHIVNGKSKAIAFKRQKNKDEAELEAAHFATFRHTNIVELYGICVDGPTVGLALELCEGGTLTKLLSDLKNTAISTAIIIDWARQICAAMEFIAMNTIHRDLITDNVLVLEKPCLCVLNNPAKEISRMTIYAEGTMANGVCSEESCKGTAIDRLTMKVTDFGLTRESTYTSSKMYAVGTTGWMAPEVFNSRAYSEFSDVWSFGVLLWVLVSRERPYMEFANRAIIDHHVSTGELKLKIAGGFPDILATTIQKCLVMDAQNRPTFRLIRKALIAHIEDCPADDFIVVKKKQIDKNLLQEISEAEFFANLDRERREKEAKARSEETDAPTDISETNGSGMDTSFL